MKKAKRIVGRANPANTPGTSKPSLRLSFHHRLVVQIRELDKAKRKIIGQLLDQVASSMGQPHLHAGIGLRKLNDALYECRLDLKTRLVFEALPEKVLYFHMMGSHDEVIKFLKARR